MKLTKKEKLIQLTLIGAAAVCAIAISVKTSCDVLFYDAGKAFLIFWLIEAILVWLFAYTFKNE